MRRGPGGLASGWFFLLAATLWVGLMGCGQGDSTSPTTSASEPAVTSAAESSTVSAAAPTTAGSTSTTVDDIERDTAAAAIASADLADPSSIDAVEAVSLTDGGVAAAAEALRAGVTGDAQWAATWIYASSGLDPDPLEPLLAAEDATVRAMAASALLAQGVRDAVAPLVALVGSDQPVRGARPPLLLGDFAASTLARYIAGPEIASGTAPADTAAAWSAWLTDHGASMTFDEASGRWSA